MTDQLGGLVCYQTDYDNDGRLDIFIPRGAWFIPPDPADPACETTVPADSPTSPRRRACSTRSIPTPRPGPTTTTTAGSTSSSRCEQQPNRLYHNRGDGTFEDVAEQGRLWRPNPAALVQGRAPGSTTTTTTSRPVHQQPRRAGRLYHNNGDGTFTDVTAQMGIDGPLRRVLVLGLGLRQRRLARHLRHVLRPHARGRGQGHARPAPRPLPNKLFHNSQGKGFEDMTSEAGLDMVFATMGSNFADFDNDGWLDLYLGTGEPSLATLVPNRMFKNVGGKPFAEITGLADRPSSKRPRRRLRRLGQRRRRRSLHRDGRRRQRRQYHNILFQNPGQGNHWLTVKLVGKKTNRAAIGARIKARHGRETTADRPPACLLGKQLRCQPAGADHRPGQGRSGRRSGNALADERDHPGLPRHRRRPGDRGHRVCEFVSPVELEAYSPARVSRRDAGTILK